MKMWAGTATGIASESYRLSGLDPLIGFNKESRQMPVDGFHAIVMTDHNIVAISTSLKFCHADLAVESRAYGIADSKFQVYTAMHSAKARTITVI